MATIAEALIQQSGEGQDVAQSVMQGADLALQVGQIQQKRAQLEHAKAQTAFKQIDNAQKALVNMNKVTSPQQRKYFGKLFAAQMKNVFPGMNEDISDLLEKDDEMRNKTAQVQGALLQASKGKLTPELLSVMAKHYQGDAGGFIEAINTQLAEQRKAERAALQTTATSTQQNAQFAESYSKAKEQLAADIQKSIAGKREAAKLINQMFDNLKLAQSGNAAALQTTARQLLKSMGEDRISDQDVLGIVRRPGLLGLRDWIEQWRGNPTSQQAMQDILAVMQNAKKNLPDIKEVTRNQFRPRMNVILQREGNKRVVGDTVGTLMQQMGLSGSDINPDLINAIQTNIRNKKSIVSILNSLRTALPDKTQTELIQLVRDARSQMLQQEQKGQ